MTTQAGFPGPVGDDLEEQTSNARTCSERMRRHVTYRGNGPFGVGAFEAERKEILAAAYPSGPYSAETLTCPFARKNNC